MSDTEEVNERSSLLRRARKDSRSVPRGDFSDRKRWWSIRVMYLTMFLSSVTFTLTISSIWPFLRVLDPSATADFLGWVVSAYSLGQLIASPLFGIWANWRGKSREPLALSITLGVGANLMYAYLQSFDGNKGVLMIAARGLIGFAAGNVAVVRSYVAGATTLKERTAAMANVSIFQSIGFILGPVIQAAFVPMSYPGPIETKGFHLNMYTAPAILGAILCFINVVLIFVVFQEFRVPDEVSVVNVQSSYEQSVDDYKPDYFAVISCILIFFVVLFIFTIFETIATPLSMDMFAWTKEQSTLYIGVLLASCGVEAIGVFVVLKMLSKRFNERYLLIGGFVLCFAGYFVQLPWGDGKLILAQSSDTRSDNITAAILEGTPTWNVQYDTVLDSEPYVRKRNSDVTVMGIVGNLNSLLRINDSGYTSLKTLTVLRKNKTLSPFPTSKAARTITTTLTTKTSKTITTLKTPITEADISTVVTIPTSTITDAVMSTAETIPTSTITDAVMSTAETIPTSTVTDAVMSTAETVTRPAPNITDAVMSTAETVTTPAPTITADVLSSAGTFITEDVLSSAETVPTTTQTVTDITMASAQTLSTSSTTPRTTTEEIMSTFATNSSTTEEPVGCPSTIPWCYFTPPVYLAQFIIGCIIISTGYPTANVMSYTLFSKILGPKPQGLWMGWLTASGSLARTLGPIFVSQIYYSSGPRVVFAIVCGIVLVTILAIIAVFRKLVPCQYTADYQTPPDS